MQKRRILEIRQHFEVKFDDAFVKVHTMTRGGHAATEQMENALTLSYAQGVLKAVDLILAELEDSWGDNM